jgi:hypothetical protein
MKKLLCPIDFSDASVNALKWAFEMARDLDAMLILFHAVRIEPPLQGEIFYLEPNLNDEVEKVTDKLEKMCEQLARNDHTMRVIFGFDESNLWL